jgi:hypothetical protein
VFISADTAAPVTTPNTVGIEATSLEATRDAHAAAAELDTPLEAAGLTPRAVSVAHGFSATTVGALLDVPLHLIAKARGAGAVVRKELNRRHKQWTQALRQADLGTQPGGSGQHTIDDLAALLMPTGGRRGSSKTDVVRLTLGLPRRWPPQSEVAAALRITQASVSRHHRVAVKAWAGRAGGLGGAALSLFNGSR